MPLKISQSVIRVAERLLGLTGTPLPTDVVKDVQLIMETRALRPWELFDEGLVPFQGFCQSPAVAAQFGFVQIEVAPLGAFIKQGDFAIVTSVLVVSPAGGGTLRLNQTTVQTTGQNIYTSDRRIGNPPVPLNQVVGEQGSAVAATGIIVGEVGPNVLYPIAQVLLPTAGGAAPPSPNLALWSNTVNATLDVTWQGIFIPSSR